MDMYRNNKEDLYLAKIQELAKQLAIPPSFWNARATLSLEDTEMSNGYVTHGAPEMDLLADVELVFNYDQDTAFELPAWPYFPSGAEPYDYQNISFADMREGFNKLVGSHWGRIIQGLDLTKQGAYQLEGEALWGKTEILANKVYRHNSSLLDPESVFGQLNGIHVSFFDNQVTRLRNTPILITGNITHQRYGLVLVPMAALRELPFDTLTNTLGEGAVHEVNVSLSKVRLPFPFYATGIKWEDWKGAWNQADYHLDVRVNRDYAIAYVFFFDQDKSKTVIQVPNVLHSSLLDHNETERIGGSPYSFLALHMQHAVMAGLLATGSLLTTADGDTFSPDVQANRKLLIEVMNQSNFTDNKKRFKQVAPSEMRVPEGLTELPALPSAQHSYIADFNGIVYVSDRERVKVMMPYQVFDLAKMHAAQDRVLALHEQTGYEYNSDALEFGRQIELIEALFEQQHKILVGTAYAYEALMYQRQGAKA